MPITASTMKMIVQSSPWIVPGPNQARRPLATNPAPTIAVQDDDYLVAEFPSQIRSHGDQDDDEDPPQPVP